MTDIVFMGAEVPSNRLILESAGVTNMSVSFWRLQKRGMPKTKKYLLKNYFEDGVSIYVHAGAPRHIDLDRLELEDLAAQYEEFISDNIERLTMFAEVTHPLLSPDFIEQQRKTCWAECPPGKFLPIWNDQLGQGELRSMADRYLDIGISGESIEEHTWLAGVTRGLVASNENRFHAIACAKPDNLRQVPVTTAHTLSWISPMTHGETIVWDGTKLVRYPKSMKTQARPRYSHIYESAGLDYDKIMDDDEKEVCKLAVWSFHKLEERLTDMTNLSDNFEDPAAEDYAQNTPAVADNKAVDMRKIVQRNPDEMATIPVFGMTSKQIVDADGVIKDVSVVQTNSTSLRQCNTCFVAANCPAYKPNNACAFNFPIELRTKEQLKDFLTALLEMQGKRIAFAAYSEELNGGYPDPNVSQEMDRLVKLLKEINEMDSSSSFVKMTLESKNAGGGVLSQLFGERANVLKELPQAIPEDQTTKYLKDKLE